MTWLRFDDVVPMHPKLLKAGHAAAWLWFSGVCYCRRMLTDGFIPVEALKGLAPTIKKPAVEASRLVDVGLWHPVPDGYQVHDFHDWNPTRADVESERKADRERKRPPGGIRAEPSCGGAGVASSSSSSVSAVGSGVLERARENLLPAAVPLVGRRNPDLMTFGPIPLWASQFRDDILPIVATKYAGDRDAADPVARAWVGTIDTANQAATPTQDALQHPKKWWHAQAVAEFADDADAIEHAKFLAMGKR